MECPSGSHGRQRFRVYVFETDGGQLYVGLTAQPVSERLREHRTGGGARSGRKHRVCKRRRDLEPAAVCATRERAEKVEERVARRLRARGYDVVQG